MTVGRNPSRAHMTVAQYRTRLIAARAATGLDQARLAAALLTEMETYQRWEAGTEPVPGAAVVAAEMMASLRARQAALWPARFEAALAEGLTRPETARKYGVSISALREAEAHWGVKLPDGKTGLGIDWDAVLADARRRNLTARELADEQGCTAPAVDYQARRRGLRLITQRERGW